jgi:hypothetical protein
VSAPLGDIHYTAGLIESLTLEAANVTVATTTIMLNNSNVRTVLSTGISTGMDLIKDSEINQVIT